jgi:hydroxypyruvate isomerase
MTGHRPLYEAYACARARSPRPNCSEARSTTLHPPGVIASLQAHMHSLRNTPHVQLNEEQSAQIRSQDVIYSSTLFNGVTYREACVIKQRQANLLTNTHETLLLLAEVNRSNPKYQCEIYHMQRMVGILNATLHEHIGQIEHIQVVDSPGRHEHGT